MHNVRQRDCVQKQTTQFTCGDTFGAKLVRDLLECCTGLFLVCCLGRIVEELAQAFACCLPRIEVLNRE